MGSRVVTQVIEICDRCGASTVDNADLVMEMDTDLVVGGARLEIDLCKPCFASLVEVTQEFVTAGRSTNSKPKKARAVNPNKNEPKECPDCGHICKGNPGLGIHRAKYHGYISPQKESAKQRKALRRSKVA